LRVIAALTTNSALRVEA
jgi:hypothetical protein